MLLCSNELFVVQKGKGHISFAAASDCRTIAIYEYTPLEPIREVWIHDEAFAAASRLSMMRIMAKRTNAATVVA